MRIEGTNIGRIPADSLEPQMSDNMLNWPAGFIVNAIWVICALSICATTMALRNVFLTVLRICLKKVGNDEKNI